ncbi:MAG: transglutaminase-like cysteine peptidase [Gammaproteobacteria bacterium]|nr:transglutaminase-like cysteine peptidase [Gammaproteobacteria bacterium]
MRLRFENYLAVLLALFAFTNAHGQTVYSFDTAEDFFAPADSWPAWQETLDQHDSERQSIYECLNNAAACASRLKSLRHVLLKGADLTAEQQVRLVNRYINRQRYKEDRVSSRSQAGNQWTTLTRFLQDGGDCEDFAVAKYFVLREFGVDAENMRIVIGREPQRATHHAMLAIRFDDSVWLLENDNTIRRNGYQDIDSFVYAINEQGIWDHERGD